MPEPSSFLKNLATAAAEPGMLLDYALYRMGRKSAQSPFGARLTGRTYSELRAIRNLRPGPHEMDLIRSLPADGVMFDIGAHVGIWTCALATAHPRATVHAFEASPRTFNALQQNCGRNKLRNVVLNQVAVSDSSGALEFQSPRKGSLFARIRADGNAQHRFDDAEVVVVPALRLDDYCRTKAIGRIDFLKVDVEGAEPRVLRGLLSEIPVGRMWIEVDETNLADMGQSIAELAEVVTTAGYRFLARDGSETDIRKYREDNMLVVPR
jgi:FkbM family methyltransferase